MNEEFGFGGIFSLDFGTEKNANQIMFKMQEAGVGYLAVSLGYFRTLFSCSGHSTSSEIPIEVQNEMGLSDGVCSLPLGQPAAQSCQ